MTSILELAAQGSADKVVLDQRVRSLLSPYYFIKVVLGYKQLIPHLHQHDTELFVTRWAQGQTEQAVEWPRAFYKTTTFTIGLGIWGVLPVSNEDTDYALGQLQIPEQLWYERLSLHDQDATQLYAFETEGNAKKKINIVKWHFEENTTFRWLFPEIAYNGDERPWNSDCLRIRRVGDRRKDPEGTFEAIGVGGALQSRHYSRIWCDDLVGEKARGSGKVMEDTIGWYQRLSGAFENATRKVRFLVSNRWGYNDLNSWVRENEPDVHFYTRAAWEIDPESGKEVSIFPEEYPLEKLMAIRIDENGKRKMSDYDFSCQYLNSPTMPGEKEVDQDGIHFYTVDENATIHCGCGKTFRASQLARYMHYDPYNAKGPGSHSCPAIAIIGLSSDEHHFVLDYFVTKDNYAKIYDKIFLFNDIWRPKLFTYEDVGHQNLTKHHLETVARTAEYKSKHKPFPRIEGISTGQRSKEQRIREGIFPIIEKKKFACRKKHQMLLKMLETFPHKVLDHDYDLLDAISQGNGKTPSGQRVWRFPLTEDATIGATNAEDEFLAHFNQPYGHSTIGATP